MRCAYLPVFPRDGRNHAGQRQQGDEVGDRHQAVKEIGQRPNQVDLEARPDQHEQHTITLYTGSALAPNRALKLTSPKKYQPKIVEKAKNSMQMAMNTCPNGPNAWLNAACVSAVPVKPSGISPEVISTRPVSVKNHERVDKYADDGHRALVLRALDLRKRVGVRRGAETGFVREQPARHAEAHRLLHCHTGQAAGHCLRAEREHKDLCERIGQRRGVHPKITTQPTI